MGRSPPAHTGAGGLLLHVLAEGSTFLGVLGVEGSGDIAHGITCTLVSFEEHLFCVFTEETADFGCELK